MRYRSLYVILALTLPLGAWGGHLTSFNVSKNENRDFSIMALHFDREVAFSVEELSGGKALQLTLQNCQLDPQTADELASYKGGFVGDVELRAKEKALVVDIKFNTAVDAVIWETRDPFSLIFDFSTVRAKKQSGTTSTAVKKPPVEKQKTQKTFKVAGAKPSPSKSTEIGKKRKKTVQQQQQQRRDTPPSKPKQDRPTSALSPQEHFLKASMLRHEGKYQAALEHFQQARKDPDLFARSTAEIANIYRRLGKDEEEIAEWEKLFAMLHEENRSRMSQLSDLTASQEFGGGIPSEGGRNDAPAQPLLRVGGFLSFALLWTIILLLGGTVWLFLTVRKLQRNVKAMKSSEIPEAPPDPLPKMAAEPDSDWGTKPKEEAVAAGKSDTSEAESPKETEAEVSSTTEKTAQEVFSLSEQGLSIQEIAERLGLGQDEVRLILNLQREEAPQA